MSFRFLVYLTTAALAGSIAFYATHGESPPTRRAAHAPYTITDILEYLLLSTGRVVVDHPTLDKPAVETATTLSDTDARAAIESTNACIHHIDASAEPSLTAAFNAADPQRLDIALRRFDAAANNWLTARYKQEDPCPPPPPPPSAPPDPGSGWEEVNGYIDYDYIFFMYDFLQGEFSLATSLALAAALLTVFLAVVFIGIILVPALIWYEFQATPSNLDRQTEIAKIVQALRS